MKDKDRAIDQFMTMIRKSWTYERLSAQESDWLERMLDSLSMRNAIRGDWNSRWKQLINIYDAFLSALGYFDNPIGWRDETILGLGTENL